jgi:hypothetical protein
MQAYLNDPTLKRRLVAEILKHQKADQIIKGTYGGLYGRDHIWKGCAIGCALHSLNALTDQTASTDQHQRFETELGIPVELAYHIDTVFENLPDKLSQTWPRRVAQAIKPGADLSGVMPALLRWMILDVKVGLVSLTTNPDEQALFAEFADVVRRDWHGPPVSAAEWTAIDQKLNTVPVWARAGAGAWAWARAWAGAGTWAEEKSYVALSQHTLTLLRQAK